MKKTIYLKWTLIAVLCCFISVASAKDIYLSTGGDDTNSGLTVGLPVLTFNKAYTLAAASGDVINVSGMIDISNDPGLNMGSGATAGIKAGYVISKNITIQGTTAATDGFDGKNLTRIFYPTGGSFTVNFKNLTLKNGRYNLTAKDNAGALNIIYSTVYCENVIFDNNTTLDVANGTNGGAVIIQNTKGTSFKNCIFSNNNGSGGGAIRLYDIANANAIVRIEGCSFINNTATVGGGGALWIRASGATMHNTVNIINSTFSNNSSSLGAIYLYGVVDPTAVVNLTNCTITNNKANSPAGCSGIYAFSGFLGILNINNSIIEGNLSGLNGVLPYWDLKYETAPTASSLMIHNSFIGRNSGTTVPVACYPVPNQFNYLTTTSTSTNLIAGLDAFNNTNNSYPLLPTSPAINNGVSSYLSILSVTSDQTGSARSFFNGLCDAGAREYSAPRVSISSVSTSPTSTSMIPVTVTFSTAVTGFIVDDITVANGTLSNFVAVNGTTYTFDMTALAKGNVTVNVASGVATDATLSTGNTAAPQFAITYDNTTGIANAMDKFSSYSTENGIVVAGAAQQTAAIYSITGQIIKTVLLSSDKVFVPATKGLYVVKVGCQNTKVLVK